MRIYVVQEDNGTNNYVGFDIEKANEAVTENDGERYNEIQIWEDGERIK